MIYLDNAATSWPKPPEVVQAMMAFMEQVGANPGRSAHRLSLAAARIVYECREALAELFGVADPLRIILTSGATEALNLVLQGLLQPGAHVVTSGMEHNSVMRPLRALEHQGIELTVVPCSPQGLVETQLVERAIQPNTRLIALNHASNVSGTLLPVTAVGKIARRHGLLFLVDAAQTAGAYPVDVAAMSIDLLAFTGHKGLYGPQGTGGLYIGERVPLELLQPLKCGGTGSRSESEEQPDFLPDKYEVGTPNTVGLAGLLAGVRYILREGIATIREQELALTRQLIEGLQGVPGITIYGPLDAEKQTAVVSFNLSGLLPSEVSVRLDEEYGVLCRVGLHCAPAAHRSLGTFPVGTVRFALGYFNSPAQVAAAVEAVQSIATEGKQPCSV